MLDETKSQGAGKSYSIGNVGDDSFVQQGENLISIHTLGAIPGSDALAEQFNKLIEQISKDNTLDADTRDISVKKIQVVAEGFGKAQKSDGKGLKYALLYQLTSWL